MTLNSTNRNEVHWNFVAYIFLHCTYMLMKVDAGMVVTALIELKISPCLPHDAMVVGLSSTAM